MLSKANDAPHVAPHWLHGGCPKVRTPEQCALTPALAAVRCCGGDGRRCASVCDVCETQHGSLYNLPPQLKSVLGPRIVPQGLAANHSAAAAECAAHGLRLCSRTELDAGACCKTGCLMDTRLVWTRDRCDAPSPSASTAAAAARLRVGAAVAPSARLQLPQLSAVPGSRLSLEALAYNYGTDKSKDDHKYVDVYAPLLEPLRDTLANLTEIGVSAGQSIGMWRAFLAPAARVWGFDLVLKPQVRRLARLPNVRLFETDAYRAGEPLRHGLTPSSMDVVIDDAMHEQPYYDRALASWWPLVRPGGYYIIEDLERSVMRSPARQTAPAPLSRRQDKGVGVRVGGGRGQRVGRREGREGVHGAGLDLLDVPGAAATSRLLAEHRAFFVDSAFGHRNWSHFRWRASDTARAHNSKLLVLQKRPTPPCPFDPDDSVETSAAADETRGGGGARGGGGGGGGGGGLEGRRSASSRRRPVLCALLSARGVREQLRHVLDGAASGEPGGDDHAARRALWKELAPRATAAVGPAAFLEAQRHRRSSLVSGPLLDVVVDAPRGATAELAQAGMEEALARLFPRLRPGGFYLVETAHDLLEAPLRPRTRALLQAHTAFFADQAVRPGAHDSHVIVIQKRPASNPPRPYFQMRAQFSMRPCHAPPAGRA